MVKITDDWIKKEKEFKNAGIEYPKFDLDRMRSKTSAEPRWVHFGGGNLYRCFHAKIAQDLLNKGYSQTGIIVADMFSEKLIQQYSDKDNRTLSIVLKNDKTITKELVASTAEAYFLGQSEKNAVKRITETFQSSSLQIVTVTITEKGYSIKKSDGTLTDKAKSDINNGPVFSLLETTMGKITYFLYKRYLAGRWKLSLISTDNFANNGQYFKENILLIASGWVEKGCVERDFIDYLGDDKRVAFPLSMIDRITPLPNSNIAKLLEKDGIEGMVVNEDSKFAPFVNTEETHYLVIENNFPNGRPDLSKVGIYLTDKNTVVKSDLMKVCSLLNPLHTALAIFGCLLGYEYIWQEMEDNDLVQLIKEIGYNEGLPVVADPGIIQPKKFLEDVICKRLPNKYIPDTPQRIATDTSQKLGIRYGETIKSYIKSDELDVDSLVFIPLTIAAWCRYLLGVDDFGKKILVSSDPLLGELQNYLSNIELGHIDDVSGVLTPILGNEQIFGINLYETSIGKKVESYFTKLIKEEGAVRYVLRTELLSKDKPIY